MVDKVVYWRDGSTEIVWHLYPSCPQLGSAPMDGTLCKGSVEAAINTGRQMVCPVCKAKFDGIQKAANVNTVSAPIPTPAPKKQEIEPEVITPAPKKAVPVMQRSTAWLMSIAFALLTWIGCYGYYDSQYDTAYNSGYAAAETDYESKYESEYESRYREGYDTGKENGYNYGKREGYNSGYTEGYTKGKNSVDTSTSYTEGYEKGKASVDTSSIYNNGYNAGYNDGYSDGAAKSATSSQSTYSSNSSSYSYSYTVYITATGSKYHSYGCSYLRNSCYSISLSDAIAQGYTACSRCNP